MKQTTTPAIKYIDGQPFVRVIDLGHMWNTNSSNILAIGKRHHVPEEQLRRIDGRVWCSFQGLRYRMAATKHGSSIAGHIREFLNAQAEKPTAAKPKPEPQPTDLGTAAAVHVVKQTADTALNTAAQAADLAQKNADIITVTGDRLSLRLDRLSEHVDHVEKDASAHRCDALERARQAERNQRDNTARISTLEEHARAVDWTLAAVAMLTVVGRVIRLLHRR